MPHDARVPVVGFLVCVCAVAALTLACGESPSSPSPRQGFSVTSVQPNIGPTEGTAQVSIIGSGFLAGATATFDGVPATVVSVNGPSMSVTVPQRAAGRVDVVVTNPGGASARLAGAYVYEALTVSSVSPIGAFGGSTVRIAGTGFMSGAVATLDGIPAVVSLSNSRLISVIAPAHPRGTVDVVVTSPGGQQGTLSGAFTYEGAELTVLSNSVAAGDQLNVRWDVTRGGPFDWVGIFNVGDVNTSYLAYEYTGGRLSGTVSFTAPTRPGQYDFRYLLDDGYVDVARSSPVTVR